MTQEDVSKVRVAKLRAALKAPDSPTRLRTALTAGTRPHPEYVDVLVDQCRIEPDFYVRDMLTWAITRHSSSITIDRLLTELTSAIPQARSQALHTLSKIGDQRTWPAITTKLIRDGDDEVARTAWRTAAVLVPDDYRAGLAETLSTQFNRGNREMKLSLSRAFVALGEASCTAIEQAKTDNQVGVRTHAIATERLIRDPDESFDTAMTHAQRIIALSTTDASHGVNTC